MLETSSKILTKNLQALSKYKNLNVSQFEHINQYVIKVDTLVCFQSYESLIAVFDTATGILILGCDFDYSQTTLKHLYKFIEVYCSYEIASIIYNATNKKKAIYNAIKSGVILYDSEMK